MRFLVEYELHNSLLFSCMNSCYKYKIYLLLLPKFGPILDNLNNFRDAIFFLIFQEFLIFTET